MNQKLLIASILLASTAVHAAITPAAKNNTIKIDIAYAIRIFNQSKIDATFSSMTINYSKTDQAGAITKAAITAQTNSSIPASKGISFTPSLTIKSPTPGITAQFEGITSIVINGTKLTFTPPSFATAPIYIDNINGVWKITEPKTLQKKFKKTKAPKAQTIEATAVSMMPSTTTSSVISKTSVKPEQKSTTSKKQPRKSKVISTMAKPESNTTVAKV